VKLTKAEIERIQGPNPDIPLVRVAFHEAGHFVAGTAVGVDFEFVTIDPKRRRWECRVKHPLRFLQKNRNARGVERWVSMLYAGYAADVRFSPETKAEAREGARGDYKNAEILLSVAALATAADRRRIRRRLRSRAAAVVAQRWAEVELLANRLLERLTLSGAEARAICDGVAR